MLRLVQPYGGTIMLASSEGVAVRAEWRSQSLSDWKTASDAAGRTWHIARRRDLPGAGQWTHMYANPANTVCSGDRLVGADVGLQWFGPPGAEDVVERHAVAVPPVLG